MEQFIIRAIICALALCLLLACGCAAVAEDGAYSSLGLVETLPLSGDHTKPVEHKGIVVRLNYEAHSYVFEALASGEPLLYTADAGTPRPVVDREKYCGDEKEFVVRKEVYVYLPYGYDPAKKYNVVYAMHGTYAFADYWLSDFSSTGRLTHALLDNMIEHGECEPFIMVSPCYYSIPDDKKHLFPNLWSADELANVWPMYFWMEMENDIMPLIESTYSTYADDEDARDHRAFVGLSRGAMTTINSMMLHSLDKFAYFGNFSGTWCDFGAFKRALESDAFKDLPIRFWYNGNGTADFALSAHEAFHKKCLKEMPDRFIDGENYCFVKFPGGNHDFTSWLADLYNALKVFFKQR